VIQVKISVYCKEIIKRALIPTPYTAFWIDFIIVIVGALLVTATALR